MKNKTFSANLILIRNTWIMNRAAFGDLLDYTEHQIAGYERFATNIPSDIIFDLEGKTGIPAKRLYYEPLTRASIPLEPIKRTSNPSQVITNQTQRGTESLTLDERVKRLEMKVFGTVS